MLSTIALSLVFFLAVPALGYEPTPENLEAREWFQDAKFGLFVHWGTYSVLGDGGWVMHRRKMSAQEYERLPGLFNPYNFDPKQWVSLV